MRKRAFFGGGLALLAAILTFVPVLPLAAQEEEDGPAARMPAIYALGQQNLAISAGLQVPLFYQAFTGEYEKTNLKLGGVGSLQWGVHLDNHWLLGLEVGGMFAASKLASPGSQQVLYQLPITIKGAYIFHLFPFEISVFLGAGMDIVKYLEQTHVNFILKPGITPMWNYNSEWGFGLNLVYWWVPQPWREAPEQGRMGNFLEISATARYNF